MGLTSDLFAVGVGFSNKIRNALIDKFRLPMVAGGSIGANRALELDATGVLIQSTAESALVVGVAQKGASTNGSINVDCGIVDVKFGSPCTKGAKLKSVGSGLVAPVIGTQATIDEQAGGDYGNQPANDGLVILSDSASDNTQTVTIYGTTNGASPLLVVSETVTLTGTNAVSTVKTNWGLVLAVVVSGNHAGTITVREASGNLAVTTLATGTNSSGLYAVPTADQNGYGSIPTVVAGGASTKYVGIAYTTIEGVAASEVKQLNGNTPVSFTNRAARVTAWYVGDVAAASTVTLKSAAAESSVTKIGRALETVATEATVAKAYIPVSIS